MGSEMCIRDSGLGGGVLGKRYAADGSAREPRRQKSQFRGVFLQRCAPCCWLCVTAETRHGNLASSGSNTDSEVLSLGVCHRFC